ncbi:MAG: AbrB/MazE/SpoVT family DNA-binding domain-containing protein [Nitrososphaerales archaeon]
MNQSSVQEQVEYTKASSKGQIVIPARIRKRLKIEEGERFLRLQHRRT